MKVLTLTFALLLSLASFSQRTKVTFTSDQNDKTFTKKINMSRMARKKNVRTTRGIIIYDKCTDTFMVRVVCSMETEGRAYLQNVTFTGTANK